MRELTEREEQEMIERAKAGDPEANYRMSLWALDRAMAEPEEERWNRLAAKCLVRAAEAGYAPAQARMEELLLKNDEPEEPDDGYTPRHGRLEAEETERPAEEPALRPARQSPRRPAKRSPLDTVKGWLSSLRGVFSRSGKDSGSGKGSFFDFKNWSDARWKRMQIICIVVCVVLALLIAILLITGRGNSKSEEAESALPTPESIATAVPSPTPAAADYPDEATRAAIAAASLDEFPEDGDFVTEETTAVVSTSGGTLNLRRGPAQRYNQVTAMPNGSKLNVYAYKDGWALVKYNDTTWGWCSSEFIK